MVTGSLLGLGLENGVLEITHAFPLPSEKSIKSQNAASTTAAGADSDDDAAGLDGHDFQVEMMRMLREVNVDNNCVGWYQSMYLGIYSTSALLDAQFSYQTDLSPNSIVVLYDPMQTSHGNLVLRCYRLTDECIRIKESGANTYLHPKDIFEQVPVKITNPGLVQVLLADIVDNVHHADAMVAGDGGSGMHDPRAETTFDRLDLSTNPYLEKHLEFLCGWVDELAAEQHKFQYYARQLARGSNKDNRNNKSKQRGRDDGTVAAAAAEGWASSDAPRRMESLLVSNQIRSYCDQMDKFSSGGLSKLFLAGGLHKEGSH
jgi:translation initiation factor 3 subunit H